MSISLHRSGLSTVLTSITGTGAGKLASGFAWPRRDMADTTLQYPFWTLEASQAGSGEEYSTVGAGGQNKQTVVTRIVLFDKYANTVTQYQNFLTIVDTVLATLRADANIRLSQGASGCVWNKIARYQVGFNLDSTPPLLLCTIECHAQYVVDRT